MAGSRGGSLAADPDSEITSRRSGLQLLMIDPAPVHAANRSLPLLSDRRSDLYLAGWRGWARKTPANRCGD